MNKLKKFLLLTKGNISITEFKKSFCRKFSNEIKKQLQKIGATEYKQYNNYFYISAFFKFKNKCFYINTTDIRFSILDNLLIRECKDYNDFTGCHNNYIDFSDNSIIEFLNNYNF